MPSDTRRLRVVVTGESPEAQQALEEVGSAAEKTESKLLTLTKTIAGFAGKGVIALGAVGTAAATMGFSTASQLEQATVGFTTMLGSAEKAQKFLKQLQDFAAKTPFEFTELTGAAQRFVAMGFSARDVIPMLTAVGDAVAAMGGSAENIDSVTTALGQMQAKGKVSGEELMQLTEQGIPALKILADSYGVSTSKMSEMITKGEVQSKKAIPALIKGLEQGTKSVKGFAGMMDKQSGTMQGKWSTFMDTLKMGLGNFANKFLPMAKKGIDVLSKAFGDFFAGLEGKGKLAGFTGTINQLGLGFRALVGALKEGDITSKGIVGNFEFFGATIHTLIKAFKDGEVTSGSWRGVLERVAAIVHDLVGLLIQLGQAVAIAVGWFRQHETLTKSLLITLGALVALTKLHATVLYVQQAGGLLAVFKNLSLVQALTRTAAAVQWLYNGAIAAGKFAGVAAQIAAMTIAQKANVVWTKAVTAATWAWGLAQKASPLGIIITVIVALVAAIIYLWKNNEGFRNFVLNVLWPALKKAWDAIRNAFETAVNAIVAAWNWVKNQFMAIWNAIWAFLSPIVAAIVAVLTPIISVIMKIATVVMGFYTGFWKVVWILVQIAVKVFVAFFLDFVWPKIKWVFDQVVATISVFIALWKANWKRVSDAAGAVANWFTNTLVPAFQKAWEKLKGLIQGFKDAVVNRWNEITSAVRDAYNKIAGPIGEILSKGINKIKGWIASFLTTWNDHFEKLKSKVKSVMDGVVGSFNKGKDGIKKAWDKVVEVSKKPVNFVINDVYNKRIRPLWNKIAEKFGIKTRLDEIPAFAKGGLVPGSGTKDTVAAMLTPGEGILTKQEMKKLGGVKGFNNLRGSIAQYNNGGVVGGDGIGSFLGSIAEKGKNFIQGMAAPFVKPLVNTIRSFLNSHLGGSGFGGLIRNGGNSILDKVMNWVTGKDKEAATMVGHLGGGHLGGTGMGYMRQMAALHTAFPGLPLISGYRPGAHTLSGNLSYHASGRAVDVPPRRDVAQWIRSRFGNVTRELITPWPELDLRNGKFHDYSYAIDAQHGVYGNNAHVHWAMDSASTVDPGWFMGYNGTGKPETLVNADKFGGNTYNVTINVNGSGDPKRVAKEIRDELINLSRRNGGKTGLPRN